MTGFGALYVLTFARPRRAFEVLLGRDERLRWATYAVAITAVVYTLVYVFLARNGGRPTELAPWLAIEPERYYAVNQWLAAPSLVLAWVAAAGFAHLLARALGGTGNYEDVVAVLGLGLSVAMWSTGLHDLATTFAGWLGALDQRAYEDAMNDPSAGPGVLIRVLMSLYVGWFLVVFAKGIGVAHRLGAVRASVVGVIAFSVFQGLFFLFNR